MIATLASPNIVNVNIDNKIKELKSTLTGDWSLWQGGSNSTRQNLMSHVEIKDLKVTSN